MANQKVYDTEYSQSLLDETPQRALQFLEGASFPPIHAALTARGYSDADHDEGWLLLQRASGRLQAGQAMPLDTASREALTEIDNWDEPNFRIAKAALARKHANQCAFVFNELQPATGAWSILSVTTFLDRLDALESGDGRKSTHKADLAALATLESRGITKAERARLRELLQVAKKAPATSSQPPQQAYEQLQAEKYEAKKQLRGWYDEWADVARAVVRRRDYLIRLGLAKRKTGKKSKKEGGGTVTGATTGESQ